MFNTWMKWSGFKDFIKIRWNCFNVKGQVDFCLKETFKLLKQDLIECCNKVFGNINAVIVENQQLIDSIDIMEELGMATEANFQLRRKAFLEVDNLLSLKESLWC
ncbi:hypothetical protein Ancab_040137 [Ancistrocladus abbreviatus]